MNWFAETRLEWIRESVEIFGTVNRSHIIAKFGVSHQTASEDLRAVQHRYPELMEYDTTGKRYVKRSTTHD